MKRQKSGMMEQARAKLSRAVGATMAEMMLVIAIIGVLGGVAFIAVWNYQRSLGQLERDNIAKEIFIAAQNHLTMAKGEGYLGVSDYGTEEADGVFYYVVNNGAATSGSGMFAQMLPFGSIEENVRVGGSYLIRYQPDMARVLDVFYCSTSGSPTRFNHILLTGEGETYDYVIAHAGEAHKSERRTYVKGNNSILGWYGGEDAANLPNLTLSPPDIKVLNRETLSVKIKDTSAGSGGKLRLLIKGKKSEVQHYLNIDPATPTIGADGYYTQVLDDITSSSGHFCKRHFDDMETATENNFIPGEDITVQAVAYSTSELANICYSAALTTNSLFASVSDSNADDVPDTAYISNFRHLENLDMDISGLGYKNGTTYSDKIRIVSAVQTTDLNWTNDNATYWTTATVRKLNGEPLTDNPGKYVPISPKNTVMHPYSCTYNGQNHSISNVTASDIDAGLFGNASYMSQISNLELIDFTVTGTTSAGALAGTLNGCTVTNVLARNSTTASSAAIISAPTAGGLVGSMGSGTTVQYSAAAVVVSGSTKAGGLIGAYSGTDTDSATKEIVGCYSGGHTTDGSYEKWIGGVTGDPVYPAHTYDVTGATAGGLIGDAGSATISNSYSTCSVSGTSKAGGFAGEADGSITNCYATGLIDQTQTAAAKYAFVAGGSPTPTLSGNAYYSVINAVPKPGGQEGETEPMAPYSGYALSDTDATANTALLDFIKPLDLNADTYNTFTGAWDDWARAEPYDTALPGYYGGKYPLKAIKEMDPSLPDTCFVSAHYGDWPSPEVFFINRK